RSLATELVWTIDGYTGFVEEHLMPDVRSVVPHVMAAPEEFAYDGSTGRQYSWQALGFWLNRLLSGTDDLPEERAAEMASLTAGCKTDLEKIRVIYDYLCNKTRYVSIQFGIGGFRPSPCSSVDKTGYGDCKALSNYFRCLLRAVGVESIYTVLNTHQPHPYPGYCSIGQHDHVMVAVPLKETGDTLLVECTHRLPLGYRPGHVAGHDVLLVKSGG
ncbi:MAG: transglutaminase family protein, partial [Bacteroidales bacterium]|nr:transglutaminase family protein [Bacteroidales bacterium]